MIVVGVFVLIVAVMAITIPPAILIQEYRGHRLSRIEQLISEYDGIIIAIGTVLLLAILALAAAHLTNIAALQREKLANEASDQRERLAAEAVDAREKTNRMLQAELQLAKFRQAWIIEMRTDLANLNELYFEKEPGRNAIRCMGLLTNIRVRLNLAPDDEKLGEYKEPLAGKLFEMLTAVHKASRDKSMNYDTEAKLYADLSDAIHAYLKNEWDRLKEDLKNAQGLEKEDQ